MSFSINKTFNYNRTLQTQLYNQSKLREHNNILLDSSEEEKKNNNSSQNGLQNNTSNYRSSSMPGNRMSINSNALCDLY
jgi:hypothetical protein